MPNDDMPAFVTIDAGYDIRNDGGRLYRSVPAYLGPQHSPLAVNDPSRGLENLRQAGSDLDARLEMLAGSEQRFAAGLSVAGRQRPAGGVQPGGAFDAVAAIPGVQPRRRAGQHARGLWLASSSASRACWRGA